MPSILRRFRKSAFGGSGPRAIDGQAPLRFSYLWSKGKTSEVHLLDWIEDGAFVEGHQAGSPRRERFQKLRMWEWQDASYRQLTNYLPRKGAPGGDT